MGVHDMVQASMFTTFCIRRVRRPADILIHETHYPALLRKGRFFMNAKQTNRRTPFWQNWDNLRIKCYEELSDVCVRVSLCIGRAFGLPPLEPCCEP
jgi:hypothetical protein